MNQITFSKTATQPNCLNGKIIEEIILDAHFLKIIIFYIYFLFYLFIYAFYNLFVKYIIYHSKDILYTIENKLL